MDEKDTSEVTNRLLGQFGKGVIHKPVKSL